MAVEDGGMRWWCGADEVVIVVGWPVRKQKVGKGVAGQILKPGRCRSVGDAMSNSARGQWEEGVE
jgi:hypothetical protein